MPRRGSLTPHTPLSFIIRFANPRVPPLFLHQTILPYIHFYLIHSIDTHVQPHSQFFNLSIYLFNCPHINITSMPYFHITVSDICISAIPTYTYHDFQQQIHCRTMRGHAPPPPTMPPRIGAQLIF